MVCKLQFTSISAQIYNPSYKTYSYSGYNPIQSYPDRRDNGYDSPADYR